MLTCPHSRTHVREERFADGYTRLLRACSESRCAAWLAWAKMPNAAKAEAKKRGKSKKALRQQMAIGEAGGSVRRAEVAPQPADTTGARWYPMTIADEYRARGAVLLLRDGIPIASAPLLGTLPKMLEVGFRARARAWLGTSDGAAVAAALAHAHVADADFRREAVNERVRELDVKPWARAAGFSI